MARLTVALGSADKASWALGAAGGVMGATIPSTERSRTHRHNIRRELAIRPAPTGRQPAETATRWE